MCKKLLVRVSLHDMIALLEMLHMPYPIHSTQESCLDYIQQVLIVRQQRSAVHHATV